MTRGRQTAIGLGLAALVVAAWLATHVYGVFFLRWSPATVMGGPLLVLTQCWLGAGMFIIAHDAMHGSLAPGRPMLNRVVGQVCLGLYAGFPYDLLARKHYAHHRHAGTAGDPDFHADAPESFWPWYLKFFREYFGWRQIALIGGVFLIYALVFRAPVLNCLLFWALPSIGSSLQLFVFGTWLPHRHEAAGGFSDRHNARSQGYPWLWSLLACFHFGYHHEHHSSPQTPWWGLPRYRREAVSSSSVKAAAAT